MADIQRLTAEQARQLEPDFVALLIDVIDGGASISFLSPMPEGMAEAFWNKVFDAVAEGTTILLGALEDGRLVGTVQFVLAGQPNGLHRGEVQKLMVHRDFRGRGIAEQLMREIEKAAREAGRTLMVLDTWQGSAADRLYRRLGWVECGVIPQFAMSQAGTLEPTVIFYKLL
jgi:acetyltransferase